jgi:hypothetical protein
MTCKEVWRFLFPRPLFDLTLKDQLANGALQRLVMLQVLVSCWLKTKGSARCSDRNALERIQRWDIEEKTRPDNMHSNQSFDDPQVYIILFSFQQKREGQAS